MKTGFLTASLLAAAALAFTAVPAAAQHRGGSSAPAGRAAPRATGPRVAPFRTLAPYRYYRYGYYPYRPGIAFGFYAGYPYYYGYPFGYFGYGFGYDPYFAYGYGGYYPPAGYLATYGSVRIQDAPRDAQVFADGYYVGIVDDFDGTFQRLNLEPGAHRIEIRPQGAPPITFDVNVHPGETVTYRAAGR